MKEAVVHLTGQVAQQHQRKMVLHMGKKDGNGKY
jgi:hypothetical protein